MMDSARQTGLRALGLGFVVVLIGALGACGGDDGGDDGSEGTTATSATATSAAASEDDSAAHHLEGVGASYAAGNPTEAQTHFDEAVAAWDAESSSVPPATAGEVQRLFDSLGTQLSSGAPAADVTSTVVALATALEGGG